MNIAKYSTITDLVHWQLESVGWSLDGSMMVESTHTTISVDLGYEFNYDYRCFIIVNENETITVILKHGELTVHPLFRDTFESQASGGKVIQWFRVFEKEYDYKNPNFSLADITNNLTTVLRELTTVVYHD